jgi:hypothetical protein
LVGWDDAHLLAFELSASEHARHQRLFVQNETLTVIHSFVRQASVRAARRSVDDLRRTMNDDAAVLQTQNGAHASHRRRIP